MLKQTPRLIMLIIRCRVHALQYLKEVSNVETFITKLQKVLLTLVCLLRKKKKKT